MSTFGRNARIPTDVRCLAWTIALLLPFTGWAAADDMTATSVPAGNPPAAQPEVWLCAGERIMELLQPGAEWPFVKQHLTGIKLYIGQLHGKRLETREQTIERLQPLVRFMRAHHLQVAVELGGCLRTGIGRTVLSRDAADGGHLSARRRAADTLVRPVERPSS
jgi:hypothetical protein